jgi:hypothetical protein
MRIRILLLPIFALLPSACIVTSLAKTAVDVVSLPVKAVSKGVDLATTSQSEADEKHGRALRKADEQRARDERALLARCRSNSLLPNDLCPAPPPTSR